MDTQKILSQNSIVAYDFDPDSADATAAGWVDMRDFDGIAIAFIRTVGTGALDTFEIIADSASDGSAGNVVIKTHAVASEPNAAGDQVWLECSAEEIAAAGTNLRYVSANLEFATLTDEGVALYVRSFPRHTHADKTADIIA